MDPVRDDPLLSVASYTTPLLKVLADVATAVPKESAWLTISRHYTPACGSSLSGYGSGVIGPVKASTTTPKPVDWAFFVCVGRTSMA